MLKRCILTILILALTTGSAGAFNYSKALSAPEYEFEIDPFFTTDFQAPLSADVAQAQSVTPEKTRLNKGAVITLATEGVILTSVLSSLYSSWYSGSETGGFHFYNDNKEWLQMDKFGHANTCYNLANVGYEALSMTGLDERRSIIYGAPLGLALMTAVEVFDGLSANWGFSWGDMTANLFGAGLFVGQQALWHEQRIALKYSYHNSGCSKYNVSNRLTMERDYIMGEDWFDRLYEDYSGITVWLACDVKSMFMNERSRYPSWLGWAIGYGAEGMTGEYNNFEPAGKSGTDDKWGRGWEYAPGQLAYMSNDARQRRLFVAPDIDLSRIPCKNKNLKHILRVLSAIKIPTPTLEYRPGEGRMVWHWLYF